MTLEEAIGVRNADEDIATGRRLTHREVYGRAIELLGGLDVVAPYVPFPLDVLKEKYRTDRNFNNTPLRTWDAAAGFLTCGARCEPTGWGLWVLYRRHGINSASCSQGVCILKEAARQMVLQWEEVNARVRRNQK